MSVQNQNPYAPGLLQWSAWLKGCGARRRGAPRDLGPGVGVRVAFAYERGYQGTKWHRSPNGQLKWER